MLKKDKATVRHTHKKGTRRKAALLMSLFIFMFLLSACTAGERISDILTKAYEAADGIIDDVEESISAFLGGEKETEPTESSEEATGILSIEDWLKEHPDSSPEDYESSYGSEEGSEEGSSTEDEGGENEYGGRFHYCYTTLTASEKEVYREVYDSVNTMRENTRLSTTDTDILDKCFNYCIMDHPELFFTDGYKATVTTVGDTTVGLSISGKYTMSAQKRKDYQTRIDKAVDKILEDAPVDDSDYEKVKYCFDYIVSHTSYNVNAANNQNIISVFINGESVCQGYTLAMKYLLDRLGVESAVIYGTANGDNHSWNIVKIDGKLYLDGGMADAIPIRKSIVDGNRRNVVVMTKEVGYRRKAIDKGQLALIRVRYAKYPRMAEVMEHRHEVYNACLDYIENLEKEGKIFVIRPQRPSGVARIEHDKAKMEALYEEGYEEARERYDALMAYLERRD